MNLEESICLIWSTTFSLSCLVRVEVKKLLAIVNRSCNSSLAGPYYFNLESMYS